MKKTWISGIMGGILATTTGLASAEEAVTYERYEIETSRSLEELTDTLDGKVHHFSPELGIGAVSIPDGAYDQWEAHPSIQSIHPDGEVSSDSSYTWGGDAVGAEQAHETGYSGRGIRIGIIDSGVDTSLSELNVRGGESFVDYTDSYDDDHGHGTSVASVIGANGEWTGVAPDVDIYAYKVLGHQATGYSSDIGKALIQAVEDDMDIVNMSLGTDTDNIYLSSAVEFAEQNDVTVIASAGNEGHAEGEDTVRYPAQYEQTIAVSSHTQTGDLATHSSAGPVVDLAAPGYAVNVLELGGETTYKNGTSIAAPHVAGIAALTLEATAEPERLKELLTLQADEKEPEWMYGQGLSAWNGAVLEEEGWTNQHQWRDLLASYEGKGASGSGNNPSTGLDSGGFMDYLASHYLNTSLPRWPREQMLISPLRDKPSPGHLVFFQGGSSIMSGLYLGGGDIGIVTQDGVSFRTMREGYYQERFLGAVPLPENKIGQPPLISHASGDIGRSFNKLTSEWVQKTMKESVGYHLPPLARDQQKQTMPVSDNQRQPGDILFFQGSGLMSGIYQGDGQFLVLTSNGVQSIDWDSSDYWQDTYVETRRLPNLKEVYLAQTYRYQTFDTTALFPQELYQQAESIFLPSEASRQKQRTTTIPLDELRPGDLLFFKGSGMMSGVATGGGKFLISTSQGVQEINIHESSYWSSVFQEAGRYTYDTIEETALQSIGEEAPGSTTGDGTKFLLEAATGNGYPSQTSMQKLYTHQVNGEREPGDVVFFQGSGAMSGIYVGNHHFLISLQGTFQLRNLQSSYWKEAYEETRRVT